MQAARSLAASRLPARSPPRTVCPACDPRQSFSAFNQPLSWDVSGVTNFYYMFEDVHCFPRPARPHNLCSRAALSPARCTHTALARRLHPNRAYIYLREAARASPLIIPLTPSLRLGRAQTPCPPPTSCSSAARGRATSPSAPPCRPGTAALAMAGAGRREAAPEALTQVCVRPGSVYGGCRYHTARNTVRVASTPTPT